jgi:protein gp37
MRKFLLRLKPWVSFSRKIMSLNKTAIEWGIVGLLTWNPVTGCQRGCHFCYAKRIHDRFNPDFSFSVILFHPERLNDPLKQSKPATIFVGSMSDVEYWDKRHISLIIDVMINTPQHTYMFLSKNPDAYRSEKWRYMPQNMMQGLTLIKMNTVEEFNKIMDMAEMPRPFLSIEPLIGPIDGTIPYQFEKIIIGAMTGPNAVSVKREWVDSIRKHIEPNRIFWKSSMRKYI